MATLRTCVTAQSRGNESLGRLTEVLALHLGFLTACFPNRPLEGVARTAFERL